MKRRRCCKILVEQCSCVYYIQKNKKKKIQKKYFKISGYFTVLTNLLMCQFYDNL